MELKEINYLTTYFMKLVNCGLHILGEHLTAGSPSCPAGHEHIGLCFIG